MSRRSISAPVRRRPGCSSWPPARRGGSTTAPAGQSAAAPAAAAPSAAPSAAAGGACSETTEPGTVAVSIKDFAFDPAAITAKVGESSRSRTPTAEPHNATLDAGGVRDGDPATERGGRAHVHGGRHVPVPLHDPHRR